jgi:hypothetical protein
MGKKFSIEEAQKGLHSALPKNTKQKSKDKEVTVDFKSEEQKKHPLFLRYYNIETCEPLPVEEITKKINSNIRKTTKLTLWVMLDLYFVYANWNTFYKRGETFTQYLKENIPISKSYAYYAINAITMLVENSVGGKLSTSGQLLHDSVVNALQNNGVKAISKISQIPDDDARNKIIKQVLNGATITENEIKEITNASVQQNDLTTHVKVHLDGQDLKLNDEVLLTFKTVDEEDRQGIVKVIQKYYQKK